MQTKFFRRTSLAASLACVLVLSGCGGSSTVTYNPYSGYDCAKLFKAMEYKVSEANVLFINHEDEEQLEKIGTGAVMGGLGVAALTSSAIILTPLGAGLAGMMALGGGTSMLDGLVGDELSDEEKLQLHKYEEEYNEMRETAIDKQCDYYSIPLWKVGPPDKRKDLINR